ncbi:hypothetical protein ON010_g160 [Phytophthora cinnamomi]|nr:hypothetical protein ON010_g160 [Phytophthora cinnamomi]
MIPTTAGTQQIPKPKIWRAVCGTSSFSPPVSRRSRRRPSSHSQHLRPRASGASVQRRQLCLLEHQEPRHRTHGLSKPAEVRLKADRTVLCCTQGPSTAYELNLPPGLKPHPVFITRPLQPYESLSRLSQPQAEILHDGKVGQIVEAVIDWCMCKGTVQYLIRTTSSFPNYHAVNEEEPSDRGHAILEQILVVNISIGREIPISGDLQQEAVVETQRIRVVAMQRALVKLWVAMSSWPPIGSFDEPQQDRSYRFRRTMRRTIHTGTKVSIKDGQDQYSKPSPLAVAARAVNELDRLTELGPLGARDTALISDGPHGVPAFSSSSGDSCGSNSLAASVFETKLGLTTTFARTPTDATLAIAIRRTDPTRKAGATGERWACEDSRAAQLCKLRGAGSNLKSTVCSKDENNAQDIKTAPRIDKTRGCRIYEGLSQYERMQAQVGAFTCDTCGYPFSRRDSLLRHQRNCRQVDLTPCDRCGLPVGGGTQGMARHQHTQRCSRFAQAGYREALARQRVDADVQSHRRARERRRVEQRRLQEREPTVSATPAADQALAPSEADLTVEDVIDLTSDSEVRHGETAIPEANSENSGSHSDNSGNDVLQRASEADNIKECAMCCETILEGELVGCPANTARCV